MQLMQRARLLARTLAVPVLVAGTIHTASAQSAPDARRSAPEQAAALAESPAAAPDAPTAAAAAGRVVHPALALYFDPLQGASSSDIVRRALSSNSELAATRLEVARARARLRQAGLRPNPTVDFESTTGRFTGSKGESETSIGFALPLEVGGRRARRIDLARAEFEAAEADVSDRERRLVGEVLQSYAQVLAALRELETTQELTDIDLKTVAVVQTRVSEGDVAPLELSLLRVEADRLRARRVLVEGRLRATLLQLKTLAGFPAGEQLRLREGIEAPTLPQPPATLEAATEIALRQRPDLRLARLNEEVARAGLRLARAANAPDVTAFTRYTVSRGAFDETPVGALTDRDKLLTFGVSVGIPILNRNQGLKAEATFAIAQAQRRREFLEAVVRSEVAAAYARYEATRASLATFEQGVIARSTENIRTIRAAYEIGALTITQLLAEQRRLVDSQREYTELLSERYRALADLQQAIGATVIP